MMRSSSFDENASPPGGAARRIWDASILDRPHRWCFEIPPAVMDLSRLDLGGMNDWASLAESDLALRGHPQHASFFDQVAEAVDSGPGFALLRSIPVETVSYREARVLHLLLGKSFGRPRAQDSAGSYLCDVMDPDMPDDEPDDVASKSALQPGRRWNDLPYHTDHAFGIDPPRLLAILCFRGAARGGAVRLVSATTLVERLEGIEPAFVESLSRPVPFNVARQLEPGDPYLDRVSILSRVDGHIRFRYLKHQIAMDAIEEQQSRALHALEDILMCDDIALRWTMSPGEVLLVNNTCVLHGRDSYENMRSPRAPRHHLRIWVS